MGMVSRPNVPWSWSRGLGFLPPICIRSTYLTNRMARFFRRSRTVSERCPPTVTKYRHANVGRSSPTSERCREVKTRSWTTFLKIIDDASVSSTDHDNDHNNTIE